jgi:hypothetical protein
VSPADGGGGGRTVWAAYDIETLHNMVQGVTDVDIETSWQQVSAWKKTNELLDDHAARLQMYRQQLVAHWPTDTSQAAAAFVSYVDTLLTSLRQGSTAAANNVTALANLTSAVSTARTEVQKAYQEYKLDATSPVTPNRQAQLTQQAQRSMAVLSGAAVDSAGKLQVPPPYTPPAAGVSEKPEHIDGPSAAMMSPPIIPAPRTSGSAPVPTAPSPRGTGSGGGGPGGTVISPTGPTLSGGILAPPPPPGVPPAPPIGALPGPISGGGALPPGGLIGGPGLGPTGRGGTTSFGTKPAPLPGPAGERGVVGRGPTGRALAPGGVIGGPVGGGRVAAGGGRGVGGARRINPVGGVLGQGGPWEGRTSRPAAGRPGALGGAAGQPFLASQRRGKASRDHDSRSWDPDDPWAVEHGVAPVLEPGPEPSSYDPGPGVIGIDR